MEDEDIALIAFSRYGQNVAPVQLHIPVLKYDCTGMTFCPCRPDRLYVFGAIGILVFPFAVLSTNIQLIYL